MEVGKVGIVNADYLCCLFKSEFFLPDCKPRGSRDITDLGQHYNLSTECSPHQQ